VLLVSVSRLEERRDKETKTKKKKNESFGRVQKRKSIWDDDSAKNRRSLGKVRRESATTTSAVLKIRSKSSALFFCKSSCFY